MVVTFLDATTLLAALVDDLLRRDFLVEEVLLFLLFLDDVSFFPDEVDAEELEPSSSVSWGSSSSVLAVLLASRLRAIEKCKHLICGTSLLRFPTLLRLGPQARSMKLSHSSSS